MKIHSFSFEVINYDSGVQPTLHPGVCGLFVLISILLWPVFLFSIKTNFFSFRARARARELTPTLFWTGCQLRQKQWHLLSLITVGTLYVNAWQSWIIDGAGIIDRTRKIFGLLQRIIVHIHFLFFLLFTWLLALAAPLLLYSLFILYLNFLRLKHILPLSKLRRPSIFLSPSKAIINGWLLLANKRIRLIIHARTPVLWRR